MFFFVYFFITEKPKNRRNNNAEFFHHIQWFPQHVTGGFEFDRYECMGRRVHVFHLRVAAGIRVRQLCWPKTTAAQCCL